MSDNLLLFTDSYKLSHFRQYPPGSEVVYSYLESRGGAHPEVVFFGLQYILQRYLAGRVVTTEKINEAFEFAKLHFGRDDLFNLEGWQHILKDHAGHLPVSIRAVPEGSVVPTHNVLLTVENTCPRDFWLTNMLESLLVQVWYPCTVSTVSRSMKQLIGQMLVDTGDPTGLPFKLHDFGFRGVSSVESAGIGGAAHLVNFQGTDTLAGIVLARDYYYEPMAGFSIPACFDSATEILTASGFMPFPEITKNTRVAQYEEDGDISFVVPSKLYHKRYVGSMVHFASVGKLAKCDLLVTPNHRMVRRSIATDALEVQTADVARYSHRNLWLQAGLKRGGRSVLSTEDRIRIAFQADGSFVSRQARYTGARSGAIPFRATFKKERKRKRFEALLKKVGWKYNIYRNRKSVV